MRRGNKIGFAVVAMMVLSILLSAVSVPADTPKANSTGTVTAPVMKNTTTPDYSELESKLQEYTSTRPGKTSVFIKDIATGQTMGLGSDEVYAAASTIKYPLILFIYEMAAEGKIDLDMKLTYTPKFYAQGTGILQGGPMGGQYTIRELSRLSLVYSDNIAWKMLLDHIGEDNLTEYEKSLGATATGKVDGLYITTPQDMGLYLDRLLTFNQEHRELGEEILYYMQNTAFKEGIPQNLPKETAVAHKMGALNDKFHDVGIVFSEHPFVITVFTDDAWEEVSLQTLAEVSRIVYDYQEKLN